MTPLHKQAMRVVNGYVEECDGNWREVRRKLLQDIGLLFEEGTTGSKLLAYVYDDVYRGLAPQGAPGTNRTR